MIENNVLECEFCKKEHDGSYGSGRFCSPTCARKFSNTYVSEEGRKNQIAALISEENREKVQKTIQDKLIRSGKYIFTEDGRFEKVSEKKIKKKRKLSQQKLEVIEEKAKCKEELLSIREKIDERGYSNLHIGKIGELKVALKFIENGFEVFQPILDDNFGVDFIMYRDDVGFLPIQVKSSKYSENFRDGTTFKLSHRKMYNVDKSTYKFEKQRYKTDIVKYFALYSFLYDEIYLIKNTENIHKTIFIRKRVVDQTQNVNVHMADDYNIDNIFNLWNDGFYDIDKIIDVSPDDINI